MQEKHHYVGLTDQEVLQSRQKHGANILTPPEKEPLWKLFLKKFTDPLIVILMVAGILSVGISFYEYFGLETEEGLKVFFEPVGIFVAIALATGLSFYFENEADKEFSILNQVNDDELVEVIRNGFTTQVPKKDIVVGDIVIIGAGQEIPADGELIKSFTLKMDESSLTGESSCRKSTNEEDFDPNATYPTNMVLRGTKVLEGHGMYKVTDVGDQTENGKVYEAAQIDDSVQTPLNEQQERLGILISDLSYIIAAAIIVGKLLVYFHWAPLTLSLVIPTGLFFWLVIKKFKKMSAKACVATIVAFGAIFIGAVMLLHNVITPGQNMSQLLAYTLESIMIAVTLIVVSVPEGLPMAVTLSLAYSMRSMLKTNNLVRKLHACETMGATTVICTDKTGTLTQNRMTIDSTNFYGLGDQQKIGDDEQSLLIKEGIAINSTAALDLSDANKPTVLGNPTEGALLLWLRDNGVDYQELRDTTDVLDELPFSTERKYMAVVVKSSAIDGKKVLYVKGAPEIVLGLCSKVQNDIPEPSIKHQLLEYQSKAMRTLGFAYQVLNDDDPEAIHDGFVDAHHLTFLGIVAISDPVREDVPAAVAECMEAGIKVKIVTGDTPATAKEIGRKIGLWTDADTDDNIITGPEFSEMSDNELDHRVADFKIISRAKPLDKKRLVEALQRQNEVVAVTGDGTNDAPALQKAHVGLSMGDGTSIAKEASDITIIDNSFSSIGRAVMWGRSLFQNIQRFLLFQLTVNVAASFIVLAGAFLGTESPLTVTQMLWVNLIMDTFAAMALASLPPSERVMKDKPRDRNAFIIDKTMAINVFGVGGIFFVLLFILLVIFENCNIEHLTDLLHLQWGTGKGLSAIELTYFFTIFVMTHFFYMFNARAFKTGGSGLNLKNCKGFIVITVLIFFGQIIFVETPGLNEMFNVVSMSLTDWIIIIIGSSLVLWIREIFSYIKRK